VGLGERALEKVEVGSYVQFMRYGFVKKISPLVFVYVHD
jgi:glutamyl-tRNA synthetase